MSEAIITRRYGGSGDTPERVYARWSGGRQAVAKYSPQYTVFQNHQRAVTLLAARYKLGGKWLAAPTPNGLGFVFIELSTATEVYPIPWRTGEKTESF